MEPWSSLVEGGMTLPLLSPTQQKCWIIFINAKQLLLKNKRNGIAVPPSTEGLHC